MNATWRNPLSVTALVITALEIATLVYAAAPVGAAERLVVGSKGFTEGIILGELLAATARHGGCDAIHRAALGGTQIVFKALERGEIDCYVEYSGTLTEELLRGEPVGSPAAIAQVLAARGIAVGPELGFDNTYGLAMRRDLADRLGLATIGDLAARSGEPEVARLVFGFSDEFVRRADGWPAVRDTYRLPQVPRVLDHALAYRGIDGGSLHVTDLYATDPEPRLHDLVLLADDRHAFREYRALVLHRGDLGTRAPEFVRMLGRLAGTIDGARMAAMNAAVRLDGKAEETVAADFLRGDLGWDVAAAPAEGLRTLATDLLRATGQHLLLVFVSLAAAIVVGVPAGIVADRRPALGRWILGVVGVIQTIPSMAVLVFMVPLLGLGWRPAALALFLYSLLPIVRGTAAGLASIPAHLREAALALGLTPAERLRLVELPMASRSILSGIKTAAVINVGTATIGGLIGAGGYGEAILSGIRLADPARLMEGAIPAALLALGLQGAFDLLERKLLPAGLNPHHA
ncbi:MAG: glycine betaine ABC transporter substrate-binding protein [Planctomycetaceae bacterium]